jgi:hypothetical protein
LGDPAEPAESWRLWKPARSRAPLALTGAAARHGFGAELGDRG